MALFPFEIMPLATEEPETAGMGRRVILGELGMACLAVEILVGEAGVWPLTDTGVS